MQTVLLPAVLERIRWAVPLNEARAALPELFAEGGLRDEALHGSVVPVVSDAGLLQAIQIEFDSVEHRNHMLATWGTLLSAERAGQPVQAAMRGREGLRALALDLAREPHTQCASGGLKERLSACSVRIDEYWPLDLHLNLLGLGEGRGLLHATEQELRARFRYRFRQRRRSPWERTDRISLALPPLGAASDELSVSLTFHGDQVGAMEFSISGAGPGVDHARILERARRKLGAPRDRDATLEYEGNPRLTLHRTGLSINYLSLRDAELCPSEDERFAAWLAQRRASSPSGSELFTLRPPPAPIVREVDRSGSACRSAFYKVHVEGALCARSKVEAELVAGDCCDQQCAPGGPIQAMLRLSAAAQAGDLARLRVLLPPDRTITLSQSRIDDAQSGELTPPLRLTRDSISDAALGVLRGLLDGWPQCPPDHELADDSSTAVSDPADIRCFVGESAGCGTTFRWISTPDGLLLDDVAVPLLLSRARHSACANWSAADDCARSKSRRRETATLTAAVHRWQSRASTAPAPAGIADDLRR